MTTPATTAALPASRARISRVRRAVGLVFLALLATPYFLYGYYTSDEAIRRQATRLLADMTDGIVTIESAKFSLFGGITLTGVRIDTPYQAEFAALDAPRQPREIFSASEVQLVHEPLSLAFGRLRVRRIIASTPALTVVYNAETNRYNHNLLFRRRAPTGRRAAAPQRPDILLRSARVTFVRIDQGSESAVPAYQLDADAWAHRSLASAYEFDCRVYGDMPHHVRGMYDPSGHRISETPFVAYSSIRQILPRHTRDFLDRFSLGGRFRAMELDYGSSAPAQRRMEIELRDGGFALPMPLGESESSVPGYTPLTLTALNGSVVVAGTSVHLRLEGRLNGAACRIRGSVDSIDLPFEQLGLEVTIEADGLAFLEGNSRARLLADATAPYHLREFLIDFDPHGRVNVRAQLRRPRGPQHRLRFLGRLTAVNASAAYRWFKYRLEKLTGEVEFGEDGIHLRGLVGQHSGGTVRVDGKIDAATQWTDVDLKIDGENVPFNDALHAALSDKHRSIWDLLRPQGRADARVHLQRKGGSRADGPGKWQTSLDLKLKGADLCFEHLPYALTDVTGQARVDGDRFSFREIRGRHGDARVAVEGWADFDDPARPRAELGVQARGVSLDDDLWNALPPRTQDSLAALGLSGRADIAGKVRLGDAAGAVDYDLHATLDGVSVRLHSFPYHICEVGGSVTITPQAWSLTGLVGRHGAATLQADGSIARDEGGAALTLTVKSENLPLDQTLAEALPPKLREVWSSFAPEGTAEATTLIVARGMNEKVTTNYRTHLSLRDGRLRYAGFPLDLEQVRADLLLTARRAELVRLEGRPVLQAIGTARNGPAPRDNGGTGARVRLSGTFDLAADAVRGGLQLEAESIPLEHPRVRAALPALLRDYLEATSARGLADIRLDALNLTHADSGQPRWDADGRLELKGVDLNLGVALSEIEGRIEGDLRAGLKGLEALDVTVAFDRLRVARWPMTGFSARLSQTSADPVLRLDEMAARVFGGALSGTLELSLRSRQPTYSMSLALSDADLAAILSAESGARSGSKGVRGRLLGRMSLTGALGDTNSREGAGEIMIHDAQVWKLPLMLAILRVLNLNPDENAFDDARVQFYVLGSTIRLSRVELYGTSLALAGAGTYDTHTDALDLMLAAGTPGPMRVPLLTELMEGAARELMEVHVTGTLSEPRIESQPLRGVKQFLDNLFMQPQAKRQP